MYATTNEIKTGNKVEIDNQPFVILDNQHVKPGKGQAFNRIKMKNMITGRVVETTYKSGDKIDIADVEEYNMNYLYREGEGAVFMDDKTFEQLTVDENIIKPIAHWLVEDIPYHITLFKGAVIEVIPPTLVEMVITETSPGVRGDSSGRVLKPATTNTGAQVNIPIFVEEGTRVKIDTRTGEYNSKC